jgi:HD-GYP domain-containing protein (c-di-GMP phosphodiesterase class II)/putative methionine-R-sulfoxide reductase with GAF domain
VATVFVLGLAALLDALSTLVRQPAPYYWTALALLALASQLWKIKVPGIKAHLSASEIVLFMIVIMFGSAPAIVTVAIDGLCFAFTREWAKFRKNHYEQAAFGLGEPVLSMWVASHVFTALAGVGPLYASPGPLEQVALPALAMGATYFVMNSGLNALVLSTSQGRSPVRHWIEKYKNLAGIFVSSASIAVVLAFSLASAGPTGALIVLVVFSPLALALHQFNKQEIERQSAAEAHLNEINQMSVSLAETLAMMAEEFDEATSLGHIRSVKKYSLWLADELGVTAHDTIEALGFAGLLHDLGKALIDDYIWGKPSRLSDAQQRIMRTHPALGARLAGQISEKFRTGVAPIIHRHHENWDGSGYPDGLAGEAIPFGARILQVADCYDALRRKRPYRQPWTHEAAMALVRERAGTMYDPAVVEAFERLQARISAEPYESGDSETPAAASDATVLPSAEAAEAPLSRALRASGRTTLTHLLQRLARTDPHGGVGDTCEMVSSHLRRLVPAALVVFYRLDDASNDLLAVHASGYGADVVRGTRMPLGKNVSGWVAANGETIINADPSLDAIDGLIEGEPGFKSLLSVPLRHEGATVGVMTLYAIHESAFREEQRLALELVSGAVGEALELAVRAERPLRALAPAGEAFGPASTRDLEELLAMDRRTGGAGGHARAVMCLKSDGDATVMLHAAMAVSESTRIADISFRTADNVLVVLMPGADASAEELVVRRIAAALPADIVAPPSEASPLSVGFACGPRDGEYWSDLLNLAQRRAWRAPAAAGTPAAPAPPAQRGLPWKV